MKHKKILFALMATLSAPLFAMEPEQPMVTLVSADKKEFTIPQAVAEQSGQIKGLLSVHGLTGEHESATKRFEFSISAPVMNEIVQLMKALQRYKNITDKKVLLDALERVATIKYKIGVFKAADLLEIPTIKDLIARIYAKQIQSGFRTAQDTLNLIRQAFPAEIANELIGAIARYYYLLTVNKLAGVPEDAYRFSVQDYLDYQPQITQRRTATEPFWLTALNLSGLYLSSLEGITMIHNARNIGILFLRDNKLRRIASNTFGNASNTFDNASLPRLENLYLDNSQIQEIDSNAFIGLLRLRELNLSNNQITTIAPHAFAGLGNLISLNLSFNNLRYIDPALFVDLPRLQRLYIDHEKLSEENREALRNALPNVELEF